MPTLSPPLPTHSIRPESHDEAVPEAIPPYKVILLDDPVTTMEFVVRILIGYFDKDLPTARRLMFEVHRTGSSHVATLPLEQAELKQEQVHCAARVEGFPFRCVLELA